MQKIRKFYRAVFRENIYRERERDRERDRDGPEFKGPLDAIAKPSDQKAKTLLSHIPKNWKILSQNLDLYKVLAAILEALGQ